MLVPQSEGLVKRFRDAFDPSAAQGVPAQVTIRYPFIALQDIGSAVLDELRTSPWLARTGSPWPPGRVMT